MTAALAAGEVHSPAAEDGSPRLSLHVEFDLKVWKQARKQGSVW